MFDQIDIQSVQVEEHFIDVVRLHLGREALQHLIQATGHIAIKNVIRAEMPNPLPYCPAFDLEPRVTHFDAQVFGFLRPGDAAAVIVRENDDRHAAQLWSEDALTGTVEVVRIAERIDRH